MIIDPLAVIAAITTLAGLLLEIIRRFMNGDILSSKTVLRSSYDRVVTINEGYATKLGEQTSVVGGLALTVDKLVSAIAADVATKSGRR